MSFFPAPSVSHPVRGCNGILDGSVRRPNERQHLPNADDGLLDAKVVGVDEEVDGLSHVGRRGTSQQTADSRDAPLKQNSEVV